MKEILFIMGLVGVILNMVLVIVKYCTKAYGPCMPRSWGQIISIAFFAACMVVSQLWF